MNVDKKTLPDLRRVSDELMRRREELLILRTEQPPEVVEDSWRKLKEQFLARKNGT